MDTVALGNWITDRNRFGLPRPPAFVLKAFFDQDAALVLVPSCQARKYLIGRRRELSRDMSAILRKTRDSATALKQIVRFAESDSAMLERLGLIYVDSITHVGGNAAHGSWTRSLPEILAQLRARDTWAAGGADSFTQRLEDGEQAETDRMRRSLLDDIDHRAGDAWRSFQARTGQRNQRASSGRAKIVPAGRL